MRNPTLQTVLQKSILVMTFLSVLSMASAPWQTIYGLLLIMTWPIPNQQNNNTDVSFPLSGMLLHIAMQNGLHIPMSSNEFSKSKLASTPTETDMIRRSELWAQCVTTYQMYVQRRDFPGSV